MNKHLKDIIDKAILCYGNKIERTTLSAATSNTPIQENSCMEFIPDSVQSLGVISSLTNHINRQVSPDICIEIHVPDIHEEVKSTASSNCFKSKSNTRRMTMKKDIDTSPSVKINMPSSYSSHEPDRKHGLLEYIPALKLQNSMGLLDSNAQINKFGLFRASSQWDTLQHLMKGDHSSSVKNLHFPMLEYQNSYSFPSHNPKLQASIEREYQAAAAAAAVAAQTARRLRDSEDSNHPDTSKVSISHQELYTPTIISKTSEGHDDDEKNNARKHSSLLLYTDKDDNMLSPYQCLIRKQIEIFTAERIDVDSTAQGRNSPIRLGQVGIRCMHCSRLPPQHRTKASTYYPSKLLGVYQAAQNIAVTHLSGQCPLIPDTIREDLIQLHTLNKATPGRGKVYWANSIQAFGLYEADGMIMLDKKKLPST